MLGMLGRDAFCDLNCLHCQGKIQSTCPVFGHKHTYVSAVVFLMATQIEVFTEEGVIGFWKDRVVVGPNDYGTTQFITYADDVEN